MAKNTIKAGRNGKSAKKGRPGRAVAHEKLNLDVALLSKSRCYKMASDDDISQSRLFEILIDRRWKRLHGEKKVSEV